MKTKNIEKQLTDLLKSLPDSFKANESFLTLLNELNKRAALQESSESAVSVRDKILNSIPNSAFLINTSGQISKINYRVSELLGYSQNDLIHKPYKSIFIDEPICEFFLEQLSDSKKLQGIEVELRSKDGSVLPFLLSGALINFPRGDYFLCVGQDISEIKKTQETLFKAKIKADEANKSKSEFLANMSHEIRTPLNGVIGLNKLMLQTDLTEDQTEYAEMIRSSADSLLSLINDILDFSKIEAGKLEIESYEFALTDLINGVSSIFKTQVKKKNISLKTEIDEDIPTILIGDMARIRQVLINLVGNAVKFTHDGHIIISALLHDENDESKIVKFSVRDTGIGIPPTKQELIFDSFAQADATTTRNFGGTGLGLSICRKLVWLMKGEMELFSRVNHGSTFWFVLPLGFNNNDSHVEGPTEAKEFIEKGKNLVVLLVEDNLINQKVAGRLLENHGFSVDVANNGREAVTMTEKKKYDLILMDLQMPVMDGLTATKEIRNRKIVTPIIALTANAMQGDEEMCLAVGMDGYTTKPIQEAELFKIIDTLTKEEIDIIF
jgi:PAS domain S-box-containing protein